GPAGAFQDALAGDVVMPTVVAVELVAIAFDGEAGVAVAFDYQVDAIGPGLHLRDYPVAAFDQLVVNLTLEFRLAALEKAFRLLRLGGKRFVEVTQQAGANVTIRQVRCAD